MSIRSQPGYSPGFSYARSNLRYDCATQGDSLPWLQSPTGFTLLSQTARKRKSDGRPLAQVTGAIDVAKSLSAPAAAPLFPAPDFHAAPEPSFAARMGAAGHPIPELAPQKLPAAPFDLSSHPSADAEYFEGLRAYRASTLKLANDQTTTLTKRS